MPLSTQSKTASAGLLLHPPDNESDFLDRLGQGQHCFGTCLAGCVCVCVRVEPRDTWQGLVENVIPIEEAEAEVECGIVGGMRVHHHDSTVPSVICVAVAVRLTPTLLLTVVEVELVDMGK